MGHGPFEEDSEILRAAKSRTARVLVKPRLLRIVD
jgi:hypothetical protein